MTTIYKTVWSIVADGNLFKGAYALVAENDDDAIEKTRALLGREGSAASVRVKQSSDVGLDLGRSVYASEDGPKQHIPHVNSNDFFSNERFVFDVAGKANVIAESKDQAIKKFGHAILGKEVGSVKFLKVGAINPEPLTDLSSYEKHMLEKEFRSVRVSST